MSSECPEGQVPGVTEHAGVDPLIELAGAATVPIDPAQAAAYFKNEETRWRRSWIAQAMDGARGRSPASQPPAAKVPARRSKPRLYLVTKGRPRR